ncbi:MAG: EF-hand domain-containing protein [archaeon]|nr:EF-hand domain-containing protein [archaeon]
MSRKSQQSRHKQGSSLDTEPCDDYDEIIGAFKFFDKDGTGFISMDELKIILTKLGNGMDEQMVNNIIKESGLLQDDQVDYEKFVKFWFDS